MQGSLNELTENAVYQNLDHHEFDELARHYFLVSYIVKDMLPKIKKNVRDTSLLWVFLTDYNVIPFVERKRLLAQSKVANDWHKTVLNMAKNHFDEKKNKYLTHPGGKMYGSPIRFIVGAYSNDPTVMFLSMNTPYNTLSPDTFKNLDCLTTLVISGQSLENIRARAVNTCPNLKEVFIPAGVEVEDEAFPEKVNIYRYGATLEAPVTPTDDMEDLKLQLAELQQKCANYEETSKLAEENEHLKAEIESLKKLVSTPSKDKEDEIASLKAQLAETGKEKETLEANLEASKKLTNDLQESIGKVTEEKEELQKQLESMDNTDEVELLKQEVKRKQHALENEEAHSATVSRQLKELTEKVEMRDEIALKRVSEVVPDHADIDSVLASGRKTLLNIGLPDTSDPAICAYIVMIQKKFNSVLLGYKETNDELHSKITEVNGEVAMVQDKLSDKERELKSLTDELTAARTKISELEEKPDKTEAEEKLLEAIATIEQLKEEAAKHANLEEELAKAKEQVEELKKQTDKSEAEEKLIEAIATIENLKQEALDAKAASEKLQSELSAAEQDKITLKTQLDAANATSVSNEYYTSRVVELESQVKTLTADNEMKDAQLTALQSSMPDTDAEMESVISSVEFLGVNDKNSLEKATESVIDQRSLLLPEGWENSPLAQASIVLMNEELKLLEEKVADTQSSTPSINLDDYPTLKNVLKLSEVLGLLTASDIDLSDTEAISTKLKDESKSARELLGSGNIEFKYGTMWPSDYKRLLDETQPRGEDIANNVTQLDFVRAIEVLKTLLEEKKLSTQSIRQIQELVSETKKVNKYKDTILSVMSKYNETDYDAVYAYVLENGDQAYKHIMQNDLDQFVADEVDNVLAAKHQTTVEKEKPAHTGISSLTEADIYKEISKVYGNDGNEFLVDKYNELSGRVPSDLPESMRRSMIMEMLKVPPVDNPATAKPATNRNAYVSSAKSILDLYHTDTTLEEIESELNTKYNISSDDTDNILWVLDAYLFVRQGFQLDDSTQNTFDAYTCKRRLLQQLPYLTFNELQTTFDSLIAKHARETSGEAELYKAVYEEITTLKEPITT